MKRIKYYLSLMIGVLLLNSCSDSFFDINTDPNNPKEATVNMVLPSGISGTAYVLGGYYQTLGGFWTQQYGQAPAASQWAEWESYNLTEDDFDRQFRSLYSGALMDYEYVRNASINKSSWKYYAISTVMQAYTYQILADLYDKVPFREALKGIDNFQPHYDDGALIYDSLLARIDVAMSKDFSLKSAEGPGDQDVVFQGEMTDWQKFANTLKLKIYLRYVNIDANKYKPQILALLAENNFLDKDASFSAFKEEQTGYNPYYNTFVDRLAGNVVANTTLIDSLTSWGDPRRDVLYNKSKTGGLYRGIETGDSKNHSDLSIDNYATPSISAVYPVYFFTKEETQFLIAEAKERYATSTEAKVSFENGVSLSLERSGLNPDTISYVYDGIKSIIIQKWIASTNKTSLEAFFDLNRTGYPDFLAKSKTSVFNEDLKPKRLFFPSSERKSNANTPAKVALTEKVWWAK